MTPEINIKLPFDDYTVLMDILRGRIEDCELKLKLSQKVNDRNYVLLYSRSVDRFSEIEKNIKAQMS